MKKIFIISLALLFLASGAQAAVSQQGAVKEASQGNSQGDQALPQNIVGEPTQTQAQAESAVQIQTRQAEPLTTDGQKVQTQTQTQTKTQVQTQTQNNGEEAGIMLQAQTRAKTITELKAMIKEQKQSISAEVKQISNKTKQKIFQNQNKVREAVHALLAAEDLAGGIGRQISQIAGEFNNSIEKTIRFEEKIQARGKIKKFFFGGDKENAEALQQEASQNQGKIAELKSLYEDCDCQQEVKEVLAEQIQNLDIEQNRLRQLAKKQLDSKGIFGWMFGWLSK